MAMGFLALPYNRYKSIIIKIYVGVCTYASETNKVTFLKCPWHIFTASFKHSNTCRSRIITENGIIGPLLEIKIVKSK